jgi:putative NIF3 family GTP cyclohydrolase 1 type 2
MCYIVKKAFGLEKVILYGDIDALVSRVAISPGSGKDMIKLAVEKGADILITGDITYHYGIDAVAEGLRIIDAGHYGIEHIFIELVQKYLCKNSLEIEVIPMPIDNPQKYL